MAGQPGRKQSSFASGELGDLLADRENLKYYRTGLSRAENMVVTPQGPARQRPYTRQISRRRGIMVGIPTNGTVDAPSGGSAAAAIDGDTGSSLTTSALSGGPHVIFVTVFPAPVSVSAVDAMLYRCSAGGGSLRVEYQTIAGWVTLGTACKLVTGYRTRRFCAPPAYPVLAQAWRVVVDGLTTTMEVEIREIRFLQETGSYGASRLRSFGFSRAEAYDIVLMEGHGDVYAAEGGWIAGFSLPHTAAELRGRWRQRLNTALMFTPTREPWRIFRENSAYEWECGPAPFVNVPLHDYGDVEYGNGVRAVWRLNFVNVNEFTLFTTTVDGEESGSVLMAGFVGLDGRLKTAIEDLDGIEPGVTVTVLGAGTSGTATITFNGEGNEGPITITNARVLNKGDAAVSWSRMTRGRFGGEPIFSSARGWPAAGIFYQQRLLLGGAPQVANAIVASMTGDPYELNTDLSNAAAPFIAPMDTDEEEAIEDFLSTRALLVFTSRAEYWVSNSVISKEQPLNPVKASSNGCAPGVPIVENEGAAIFADRSGSVICEFRYNEVDQTYVTARLSLLASHLVKDVTDLALKRSDGNNDANVLALVQGDGAMRLITLLREQDITAFARVTTDGLVRAVNVNAANRMTIVVERLVAGQLVPFVERFEEGLLVDQAVTRNFGVATNVVSGLTDHEGASVWAITDAGKVMGPFTVAGGTVILPEAVTGVTIGRWAPFYAETLPPTREIGPEIVTQSDIGFHTVRASISDTTSLALGANGQPAEDMSLRRYGSSMDVPELAAGFTGLCERDGIDGDQERPSMVVTQTRPGRITLRAITGELGDT
ncbi:Uncharacterised protein [Starkeya nomas]|uniref:Uncharacterized protein n=1 Tax=Starkeya nomas TaxID=2666134 RepID=A0A5S9NZQ7_9HYPH|nr:hypothetical protein [Starkeya nomas]CAA0096255.1 Uncharacterised protein [Starkeya nomas]